MIADLWQRKGKIGGCFKNSTSVVFQQSQNEVSLRADFTIVEEFEGEKEKVKSALSLQLFRSRDKSYPPSLLYKDQSRSVFDFAKVLFSLTLHLIG